MTDVIKAAAPSWPLIFGIAMGVLSIQMGGCTETGKSGGEEKKMVAKTIQEVLNEYTDEWMSIAGVVGTAEGLEDGKPCIKVYVIAKTPELDKRIPSVIHGYPVVVEETGEIRALPGSQE